ncbi:MAG: hypothetical protein A2W85_14520 [Bacteroidetes bacterium GWF2_41_31]|nr:MAG: hypothetical protein A2W85_14520 [Bacteroidetes bacterium GWF2_41_31]
MIVFISTIFTSQLRAEEYKGDTKQTTNIKQTTAGCSPASAYDWLDINNVLARINTGGDMWWDLPGGVGSKYYIPKGGAATSMFSGSLWVGGLDINNQLKLAAQRYRQVGIDYWTGPLTIDGTAAIDNAVCAQYDQFFKITRAEVDEFLGHCDPITGAYISSDDYQIPPSILNWPAHGDVAAGQSYYLAPFYDVLGDGEYDPLSGDYPYYDIPNELCHTDVKAMEEEIDGTIQGSILADQVIKGDQTLWWVFNDKGNIHTETTGSAIGLEIRAQAFAFATNDVINNMTFYSYEIINRSTFELTQTYFSPWVDTDLGYAWDDFVGCDVGRGLGYCYNGKAIDGSGEPEAYGDQPPAIGVDFFQGPYMDPDGYDNPSYLGDSANGPTFSGNCEIVSQDGSQRNMTFIRNGVHVTEPNLVRAAAINGVNFGNGIKDDERFGMRRFVYHSNTGPSYQTDPSIAPQYYNYLKGIWKDNTKMQYGGTAHIPGDGTVGPECDFMFPGNSDPCNWGTGGLPPNGGYNVDGFYWTEETGANGSPNPAGDRRFMQSAGPFTLKSGAVNYITVGIPWARATSGGPFASVELLRVVDDKCQKLFDNCFKVIDGPSAPDLAGVELDQKLIIYITNSPSSNNYRELYQEYDPNIIQPLPQEPGKDPIRSDSIYRFEGYQIFQLAGPTVSVDNLHDADQARLVAQFDVKNGVTKLVNYVLDDYIGGNVPVVEVDGGDNGIQHSFEITQDAFATGDVALVNNKQYYYMALAYAYNNYLQYAPGPVTYLGQTRPYLSGRKNIKTYIGMPHKTVNGTVINGGYGDGPQITRIAGNGNGGMSIELTEETVDEIMSKLPAGPDNPFGSPDYPIAYNPVYKVNAGPLNVKIVDPLSVVDADYVWWMDTLSYVRIYNVTNRGELIGDTTHKMVSKWTLMDKASGDQWESDTTILIEYEQLFVDKGFSINVEQPYNPGPIPVGKVSISNALYTSYDVLASNNGLITATIEYADSSQQWLSGVEDFDLPGFALDWIRSGTYKDAENASSNDWNTSANPDNPWDPNSAYEKILNGTWAPYSLVTSGNSIGQQGDAESSVGPAFSSIAKSNSAMENLASVDIVFTPDKSKWSRCPVLEAGIYPELAEGEADRFALRASPSVDKDGNFATPGSGPSSDPNDPNYISDHGMGWFPGYAINLETGERLNMMFAEDSYLVAQNGRDMILNPTKRDLAFSGQQQLLDTSIFKGTYFEPVFGGKHYVYVMDHRSIDFGGIFRYDMPAYDAGAYSAVVLDTIFKTPLTYVTNSFYALTMYAGIPMGVRGQEWLSNEATIKIRISKPYQKGYSTQPLDTIYPGMDVNNFYPMFEFSTKGLQTEYHDPEKFQNDLDLITVVPNPYYAYSEYEKNALDNRVKITNLPKECTITIYTVSGLKLKQFTKDSPETTIEWDLKNFASVPIAGGVYYVHIKSAQGERVVKWFCITRIPDLNTF